MITIPMDYFEKEKFHRKYRKVLREIARALDFEVEQYTITTNRGGGAVLGETVLHASGLYVCVGGNPFEVKDFLFRSCRGTKDFVGGPNQWLPIEALDDRPKILAVFSMTDSGYRGLFNGDPEGVKDCPGWCACGWCSDEHGVKKKEIIDPAGIYITE